MRYFLFLILAYGGAAFAQQAGKGVSKDRIEAAVKKAVAWLKAQQTAEGCWVVEPGQAAAAGGIGQPLEALYPDGTTALVLFALLKAGVPPSDPAIKKGFAWLRKQPFKRVYSVSCLILALSALYQPKNDIEKKIKNETDPKKIARLKTKALKESPDERKRKSWRKRATPADKRLMEAAVRWLIQHQGKNIWRYPGPMPGATQPDQESEDFSNTQYAVLALHEAHRLGIQIPQQTWIKIIEYCLKNQQATGPEVSWFPVPAADFDISHLKKMEKEVRKQLSRMYRKEARAGATADDLRRPRTIAINPYKKKRKYGAEKKKMYARGWRYRNEGNEPYSGSMTTSGIAALVICKAALEGTPYYKQNKERINKAIRDGAAWLAHNFTVSTNPGRPGMWHYYYLYGLERAGVLSLCTRFGKHDWYEKGANFLLGAQRRDGSWPSDGMISALSNTCFAILFLKKATTPVIGGKELVIATGKGLFGGK
ncbi:MAG: hypothetical protein DRP82_08075 [Planctomycetota bacterium]|nr:MAG: hypothetical protein DRP82_08075 [Planctomycetota bacterium]